MAPVIYSMLVLIFNLKARAFPLPALEIDSGSGDIDNEALMLGGNSTDNIISSTEHFTDIGTTSNIHVSSEKINSNPVTTTNMTGVSESVSPFSTVSSTSLGESTMIDTTKMADVLTSTIFPSTTKSTGNTGFTETTSFEDITSSENNQNISISTIASTLSESQSSIVTKTVSTVTSLDTTHVNIDTSSNSVFPTKVDTTTPEVSSSIITDRVSDSSTYTEPESANSTSSTAKKLTSQSTTSDKMAKSDAASFTSEISTNEWTTTEISTSPDDTSTIFYISDTTITTSNVTSRTTEGVTINNTSTTKDNTLLHLAYILPSAFIIVLSIVISVACLYRHRKQTPKTTSQDGGYVMKRQRSFSNPAFMEQNINALAYQLNSRDSMMPSILRTKLRYHGNSFEDINLSEEDDKNIDVPFGVYLTKQDNSKNSLNAQEISSSVSKSNLSLVSMENEKSKYVPPIPEKGQKIENSRSEDSPYHYDILPQRESLPIKQRHNSSQGLPDIQSEAVKNPEYDVLPLRTFHNTPHSEVSNKSLENKVSIPEIIPDTHSKVESMDDTPDNNDDKVANSETNLNSLTENHSLNNDENGVFQQEMTDVENVRNEAIYKIREREPATRAPSFVVLPRAPSGSMRTAL